MNNPPTDIVNVDFWADRIAALIKLAEHYGMAVEITGGELVVSRQVSDVFVAQTEVQWRAAPSAAVPAGLVAVPPTTTDRAAVSAKLWAVAEHHIVAEWICCEPLDPKHDLCAKGYAALGMAKTLLVDSDPEQAWNPAAPVLDAVMTMLPPPADRIAAPTVWIDGHPQLEAIAAAVWEHCRTEESSTVVDDPRNIAVAAYAAILAVLPAEVDTAAIRAAELDDTASLLQVGGNPEGAEFLRKRAALLREVGKRCPAVPRRGDAAEQWLKAQRDASADHPQAYQAADGLLDLYRLHADTRTPLSEHVCTVGDCDCLEAPAAASAGVQTDEETSR